MKIESKQCVSLVKRYNQLHCGDGSVHPNAHQIKQRLSERINNGTADLKLFPFLNHMTDVLLYAHLSLFIQKSHNTYTNFTNL